MVKGTSPSGSRHFLQAILTLFLGLWLGVGAAETALAQNQAGKADGEMRATDVRRAIDSIGALGRFYDGLRQSGSGPEIEALWSRLAASYSAAEVQLSALDRDGRIRITGLPSPRQSRVAGGVIEIDSTLNGQWPIEFVRHARRNGDSDSSYIGVLSTVLIQALYDLAPNQDWDWYRVVQRKVDVKGLAPQPDPTAFGRYLATLWYLKDRYFYLSRLAGEASTKAQADALELQRIAVFSEILQTSDQLKQDHGSALAARFENALLAYDRQVQSYAVSSTRPAKETLVTVRQAESQSTDVPKPAHGSSGNFKRVAPLELVQSLEARLDSLEYVMHVRHQTLSESLDGLAARESLTSEDIDRTVRSALADVELALSDRLEQNWTMTQHQARQMDARLTAQGNDIAALRSELNADRDAIEQLKSEVSKSVADQTASLDARIAERLAALDAKAEALGAQLATLEALRVGQTDALGAMRQAARTDVERLDRDRRDTDARLDELSGQVDALQSANLEIRKSLTSGEVGGEQVASLRTQISTRFDQAQADTARQIADLNLALDDTRSANAALGKLVSEQLAASAEQTAALDARIDGAESAYETLAQELEGARGADLGLRAHLSGQLAKSREETNEQVQQIAASLANSQHRASGRIGQLSARLESLEDDNDLLAERLTAQLAAATGADQAIAEELRQTLASALESSRLDIDESLTRISQRLDQVHGQTGELREEVRARPDPVAESDLAALAELTRKDNAQTRRALAARLMSEREDVERQLTTLAGRLDSIQGETGQLRAQLAALPSGGDDVDLTELRQDLSNLATVTVNRDEEQSRKLAALGERLEQVQGEAEQLRRALAAGSKEQDIAALRSEVSALAESVARQDADSGRDEIGRQMAALGARLDEVQGETGELRAELSSVEDSEELTSLRGEVAALADQVARQDADPGRDEIGRQMAALGARLDEVQGETGELRAELSSVEDSEELTSLRGEVAALADQVARQDADPGRDEIGRQMAALGARLDEVQGETGELRAELSSVEDSEELTSLRGEVAALADQVARQDADPGRDEIGQQVAALGARLDEVQGETGELRQALATGIQEAELASLRDEMTRLVATATEQNQVLSAALEESRQDIAHLAQQLAARGAMTAVVAPGTPGRAFGGSELLLIAVATVALIGLILCVILWRRLSSLQQPAAVPSGAVYVANPSPFVTAPTPQPAAVAPAPTGQEAPPSPARPEPRPLPEAPSDAPSTQAVPDQETPVDPPATPDPGEDATAESPPAGPIGAAGPEPVVEALRRGDLAAFETRFAKLAALSPAQARRVAYSGEGEDLAIVCRALGLDKLHFTSILLLSRKAQPGARDIEPRNLPRVMAVFDQMTEESALAILEYWRRELNAGPDGTGGQEG